MKSIFTFFISFCFVALASGQLVITAVFDGPLPGGTPKGVELYATEDIGDLSIFALGSANNGGGSDGEEFIFPADAVGAGEYIYIGSESPNFLAYFGFAPNYETDAANINGDDAIELFKSSEVIDVFGDINTDGSGTSWEYLDGWVARKTGTGPDGSTFVESNWIYSGIDALDGTNTNDTAPNPVPLKSYADPAADYTVEVMNNFFSPADLTIFVGETVKWVNESGFHNVNGTQGTYPDNPESFTSGGAGTSWEYSHTFTIPGFYVYQCDPHESLGMKGSIIVEEVTIDYPLHTIAEVTTEDADGVADSVGLLCELQGVVHGINNMPGGLQFALIDANNNGIIVFSNSDLGYTVAEGDELSVKGTIGQYRGLTQINPAEIAVLSSDNGLVTPFLVTALNEDTESSLVKLAGVTVSNIDTTGSSGYNVTVTDGTNDHVVRIDADTDIDMATILPMDVIDVTGIGGQFASSTDAPFNDGYQILPRYQGDIAFILSNHQIDEVSSIDIFPTVANKELIINSELGICELVVMDISGKISLRKNLNNGKNRLDVSGLTSGTYVVSIVANEKQYVGKFIKP